MKRNPIILKIFEDCDLRCQHIGLSLIAKKSRINIDELKDGEFCLFFNVSKNRVKLLTGGGLMVYLKSETGEEIDMVVIQAIPTFFHGTHFDVKRSNKAGLRKVA